MHQSAFICFEVFEMKMEIDREWFERRVELEGDLEIGVGFELISAPRKAPPAYDNCMCGCHRSPGMLHVVACCRPSAMDRELLRQCAQVTRSRFHQDS